MPSILHCDINNFYASVECLYNPSLRDKPFAVTGDAEERHGIILAKNYPAKAYGVKTGETIREAKNKCPSLITMPADFKKYLRYSEMIFQIFLRHTDRIEPFGIDEAWLDVGKDDGVKTADEIRKTVYKETGVTVSVGVSFNKIFAKLGSDLKKPDATTVMDKSDFKVKVWPLPASKLLYVGESTARKLYRRRIFTIGDLANADGDLLAAWLGKWGQVLKDFACGRDFSRVRKWEEGTEIKSIGNGMTCYRDLQSNDEVKALLYVLAESVSSRLKKHGLFANLAVLHVKDNSLSGFTRQGALPCTQLSEDIARKAFELFLKNYTWQKDVRALGISVGKFGQAERQLGFFDGRDYMKMRQLECAIENLRQRYGHDVIQRGRVFCDKKMIMLNPEKDNVIHPVSYTV